MKNFILLAVVVISSYGSALAQSEKKPEFFAGYSYESVNTGISSSDFTSTTSLDNRFKLNGFHFSAADHFTKRLGLTADFSAHFDNRSDIFGTTSTNSKTSLFNITGGPQLRFPTANLAGEQDDNDIVHEVFSPITDQLNLTAGQKFRIANIAMATMRQADPLFEELDLLDSQLSEAAFAGRLDESQIRQLSEKQAALLSQIISMKARAKMSFYRVLTAEQRAVVADQFRLRSAEGSIGSISN